MFYEKSSIIDDGKIWLLVSGHSLVIDEEFFASLFHLPNEGISSFFEVSVLDVEEMQVSFSTSGNSIKVLNPKGELKFEFQLLSDIAKKGILAKAGSFAALTLDKFQVKTVIMTGTKVNWSSIIFFILKNMMHVSK